MRGDDRDCGRHPRAAHPRRHGRDVEAANRHDTLNSHLWLRAYRPMSLLPAISVTGSFVLVACGGWRAVNGADGSGPGHMEPLVTRAWTGTERPDCRPGPGERDIRTAGGPPPRQEAALRYGTRSPAPMERGNRRWRPGSPGAIRAAELAGAAAGVAVPAIVFLSRSAGRAAGQPGTGQPDLNVVIVPAADRAGFFVASHDGLFAARGLQVRFIPVASGKTVPGAQAFGQCRRGGGSCARSRRQRSAARTSRARKIAGTNRAAVEQAMDADPRAAPADQETGRSDGAGFLPGRAGRRRADPAGCGRRAAVPRVRVVRAPGGDRIGTPARRRDPRRVNHPGTSSRKGAGSP
jgi:hypothetical protein